MANPVFAAVMICIAIGTVLFFVYNGGQNQPQEQPYRHSSYRHSNNNRRNNSYEEERFRSSNIHECAICLSQLSCTSDAELRCKHKFHKKCIDEWINICGRGAPCPICRSPISYV